MSDLTTSPSGANYTAGSDAPAPAPVVKPTPRWEDFIDIFYNPSAVFARRANSGFGVPMLVVTLLIAVVMFVAAGSIQNIIDADITRAIAVAQQKPGFRPEAVPMMRSVGSFMAKYGSIIMMPVFMFLVGLSLWVLGKFVDAKESLNAALLVAAYAYVPRVLGAIVIAVQALLLDPQNLNGMGSVSVGPARFINPDTSSAMLVALASRLDLFVIWSTVLLAIGLAVVAKIPRSKAAVAAVGVWVLASLGAILQAARA